MKLMSNQAFFKIKRKGYDRDEVDAKVSEMVELIDLLEKRNLEYQKQIESQSEQILILKKRHKRFIQELSLKEKAAEEMARLALREANSIIERAYDNADLIVREAMSSARQVLVEIARISNQSQELKQELKDKIEEIDNLVDSLALPNAPNLNDLGLDQDKS